ncbi:MAG: hypothetical protein Q8918_17720 [Bacteroidota bacterium]|nr:hypothetical protein [Bacteroidota bacterium]
MRMNFSIVIPLILLLLGCAERPGIKGVFTRDIADLKDGKSDMLCNITSTRDSIRIDTLENGFDSMQIRIWFGYVRTDTIQILALKNSNHVWSSKYYEVLRHINRRRDSLLYYSFWEKALPERLDLGAIVDSLVKMNILTLPDCRKVPNYDFPFDGGSSVVFEIATPNIYRLYYYQNPGTFNNSKEAVDVNQILNLLAMNFNIKYLRKF